MDTVAVEGIAEGTGAEVDIAEGIAEDTGAEVDIAEDIAEDTGAEGIADTAVAGGTEEGTAGMEMDIGTVVGVGPTSVWASQQGRF